ncbi:SIMPL domain-containing protein [Nanoarchaeota archaeon]
MKNKNLITPVIVLIAIIILAVTATNLFGEKSGLTVSGSSEYEAAPNKVDIYFEVYTNASTAQEAQEANSIIVDSAVNALKTDGIPEDKIQTLNYRMNKKTYWDPETRKQVEQGYEVSHNIKIEVSDMLHAGTYIDVAIMAGATRVSYIQLGLTSEKENEAKGKAIELAAANARSKAEGMAAGLGMELGKLISVSDSSYDYSPSPRYFEAVASVAEVGKAVDETVISPGTLTITGRVNLRYALK